MNENNSKRKGQESDIRYDTMKQNKDYDEIDLRFIDAIDEILNTNEELGIKPANDSSLGKIIYPSNRSIISSVRSRSKHIPHLALINFAKTFKVDMNYFYGTSGLDYKPTIKKKIQTNNNSVTNSGNGNNVTHAGNGDIKEVNSINNEAETMINNFMGKLDKECVNEFFKIIAEVRKENKDMNDELRNHLEKKSKQIEMLLKSHKKELKMVQKELKKSNKNLFAAQKNESDTLKKYISAIQLN